MIRRGLRSQRCARWRRRPWRLIDLDSGSPGEHINLESAVGLSFTKQQRVRLDDASMTTSTMTTQNRLARASDMGALASLRAASSDALIFGCVFAAANSGSLLRHHPVRRGMSAWCHRKDAARTGSKHTGGPGRTIERLAWAQLGSPPAESVRTWRTARLRRFCPPRRPSLEPDMGTTRSKRG